MYGKVKINSEWFLRNFRRNQALTIENILKMLTFTIRKTLQNRKNSFSLNILEQNRQEPITCQDPYGFIMLKPIWRQHGSGIQHQRVIKARHNVWAYRYARPHINVLIPCQFNAESIWIFRRDELDFCSTVFGLMLTTFWSWVKLDDDGNGFWFLDIIQSYAI